MSMSGGYWSLVNLWGTISLREMTLPTPVSQKLLKKEGDLIRQLLSHLSVSVLFCFFAEDTTPRNDCSPWVAPGLGLHFEWTASSENRSRAWMVQSEFPAPSSLFKTFSQSIETSNEGVALFSHTVSCYLPLKCSLVYLYVQVPLNTDSSWTGPVQRFWWHPIALGTR